MNKLFVVIPALNEENLILKTLDSLSHQTRTDFSVIVVDNGSIDVTSRLVADYSKNSIFPLFIIEEKKVGVGYARNSGTKKAIEFGAEFIAGTDADTLVQTDWIESIYEGFKASNCDLLCGECDPVKNINIGSGQVKFIFNARSVLSKKVKPYVRGANYAITSEIFRKVGGIKQPLTKDGKPAPGEDGLLEIAVMRQGAKVCRCLPTVFPHPRRYISNLQKISTFKGQVHEGGVVTQIRNEKDLENSLKAVPTEVIDIFADKISVSLFNEYVFNVYKEPVLRKAYWKNSLKVLKPFGREEIENDLSNENDKDHLWNKYKETFFQNIRNWLSLEALVDN